MKIFTSYFAKLKTLPDSMTPISIALQTPAWFKGLQYKPLSPTPAILSEWHQAHDKEKYRQDFNQLVLSKLNPNEIVQALFSLAGKGDIVLLCYEKPEDFCHRHLVAAWLTKAGFPVEEFREEEKSPKWEQESLF